MPRVDAEIAYDEAIDEARPAPRPRAPGVFVRARHRDGRTRRLAERSQRPVWYDGMYAVDQHSRDRENARRLRQAIR
jgi:hypothetical protein